MGLLQRTWFVGKGISPHHGTDQSSFWSGTGNPDDKLVLDLEDDAAHANWGGTWRMPTNAEFKALLDATYWAWNSTDKGYYVYAPNPATDAGKVNSGTGTYDKSSALLFFPAAGYGDASLNDAGSDGDYWSSSLFSSDPRNAYGVWFLSSFVTQNGTTRYHGRSVRPLSD